MLFAPLVSVHQCAILSFVYSKDKRANPGNLKKAKFLQIGEHLIQKYVYFVLKGIKVIASRQVTGKVLRLSNYVLADA